MSAEEAIPRWVETAQKLGEIGFKIDETRKTSPEEAENLRRQYFELEERFKNEMKEDLGKEELTT